MNYYDIEIKILSQEEQALTPFTLYHLLRKELELTKNNHEYSQALIENELIKELKTNNIITYKNNKYVITPISKAIEGILTRYANQITINQEKLTKAKRTIKAIRTLEEKLTSEEEETQLRTYKYSMKNLKEELIKESTRKAINFIKDYLTNKITINNTTINFNNVTKYNNELMSITKKQGILTELRRLGLIKKNTNGKEYLTKPASKETTNKFYLEVIKQVKRKIF